MTEKNEKLEILKIQMNQKIKMINQMVIDLKFHIEEIKEQDEEFEIFKHIYNEKIEALENMIKDLIN